MTGASKRPLRSLRASFYRGGTSKALVLLENDLPSSQAEWSPILLSAMGSPDPNARQLDGMGGGLSSLSKVCVVKESEREDADVDYTFIQVGIKDTSIDYAGNCGNMSSAIGPFAIEQGLPHKLEALTESEDEGRAALVRIYNTNTKKIIHAHFPVLEDGQPDYDGDFAIDGVADTAARIKLDFIKPGGSRTGKVLPTGNALDTIPGVPGLGNVPASLIDCANPCVFLRASDLKVDGTILPDAVAIHPTLLDQLEDIRRKACVMMGLTADIVEATNIKSVPKVCFVSPPSSHKLLTGETVAKSDIVTRTISTLDPHRAIPITVAVCTAAAANIPGSVVHSVLDTTKRADPEGITIAHPSGKIVVGAETGVQQDGSVEIKTGTIYRTARKLFVGKVFYRA